MFKHTQHIFFLYKGCLCPVFCMRLTRFIWAGLRRCPVAHMSTVDNWNMITKLWWKDIEMVRPITSLKNVSLLPCPTQPTWIYWRSNPGLWVERPAFNRLSHGRAHVPVTAVLLIKSCCINELILFLQGVAAANVA